MKDWIDLGETSRKTRLRGYSAQSGYPIFHPIF